MRRAACRGGDTPAPVDASAVVDAAPADADRLDTGTPDAGPPCADDDGDGYRAAGCGGDDCDDADPARHPGATDVCDGDDEDCDDTTFGPDADGDGYVSSACCNGTGCGDDCDDTLNTVNPRAAEQCNAGIDDDCDGLSDAADGVCVPCATGYVGFDGDCSDVNECATPGFCGTGAASCTNVPGTFVCTCTAGFTAATTTGALCENVDECAAAVNPCGAGTCTDNAGSYACTCLGGYRGVSAPAIGCVDIDECAETSGNCDESPSAACTNTPGRFTCTCPAGYEGSGRGTEGCNDIDGVGVASGGAVMVGAGVDFAPRIVNVVVTTETGTTRTYVVSVGRGSAYLKASNTGAVDQFGSAMTLSADGMTLAVGAHGEDSAATGIGGDQTSNASSASGAVYVF